MKILYDHQAFQQILGGVSRYYVETIKHLDTKIEREIAVRYSRNIFIKEILPKITYPLGNIYLPYKRRIIRERNLKHAISCLNNSKYDVFHATFDDNYFIPHVKSSFIITVHDLIPESEPGNWSSAWLECRKQIFHKANHIICVSSFTKNELLLHYPNLDKSKISIIYHGYDKREHISKYNFHKNYILFVGGRRGYKNFERFAYACAPLLNEYKDLRLFCTGEEFSKEEYKLFYNLKISPQVIQKQVDENELLSIYKNALVFVFPSLKEGFGLPILEAWGNGCPVALSNAGPFPEIAGDAAKYFNPLSEADMLKCIKNILFDNKLREDLAKKGGARVQQFTWEKSTIEHERIYYQIMNTLR
jgi:glycosyltransferase involved in cell wall biosynthesis